MSNYDSLELSRRAFLAAATGTVLSGTELAHALGSEQAARTLPVLSANKDARTFSFPLLGDLHFDRLEHHDMDWLKLTKPNDVHQVQNYSRITQEVTPSLFRAVHSQVTAAKDKTPFVLHIGDLVEGLCGSGTLSEKQNTEALAFVQEANFQVPFLFIKGNHDITGPGSPEAFNRVFLPFLAAQTRQEMKQANFTFTYGSAQFVFFDAYDKSSLEWLEQTLKARTAQHLFVIIHPPVAPYDARSLWHIYAKPQEQPSRARLLNLLGKNHAIALCGHLHKYGTVVRKTEGGAFVQVATCSVIPSLTATAKQEVSGIANYGPELVKLEAEFEPKTEADRRAALVAEKPFISYFEYADAPGYAVVKVDKASVRLDLYTGVEQKVWRSLDLTGLLAKA